MPIVQFAEPDTIRLISTAYISEPALKPLADDDGDLAYLEELEGLTSPRRRLTTPVPGGVHPDELLSERHGFGWSYVNAAFCYTRASGNRFNRPERGAWYATWGPNAVETAQSEVAWHLTRELDATGIYENITAYCELIAGFTVRFHDLASYEGKAVLDPDPDKGYPAGQALAAELFQSGSQGVIYPSARKEGGSCLAAFRPHIVQNIRQGDTWSFVWSGGQEPAITRKA
ncbi:RES family NAD+ phosphorylase [Pelagibius litoralis]|uniref:RES family NAD+ phosphorylase n=1 Tax=Pelagibius litoralis TaxID=374515 RepID=A0A967F1I9_9PROT|nr:RES family NAD+ phosphorylase [Pelagibius litoralis]